MTWGPGGTFFVADAGNHKVRQFSGVNPSSTATTYAGSGAQGYAGDGGMAVAAHLDSPRGLAWVPGLGLLIAEAAGRIRLVQASDDRIFKVAGCAAACGWGEGVPAQAATMWFINDVAADDDGNLFYGGYADDAVRQAEVELLALPARWHSGSGDPDASRGRVGDFYLDTATGISIRRRAFRRGR